MSLHGTIKKTTQNKAQKLLHLPVMNNVQATTGGDKINSVQNNQKDQVKLLAGGGMSGAGLCKGLAVIKDDNPHKIHKLKRNVQSLQHSSNKYAII